MLELEALDIRQEGFRLHADWSLPRAARLALIGPSGAGKSTLLSVIAGFFAPVSGRVLWEGRDITAAPPGARPVAMLFQDNNLFAHLTLAQNLGLGLRADLRLDAAQRAAVSKALARVGLAGMEARRPAQLSGGQQGRAALARVLLQDRPLLLLDEPFAALGPAMKSEMLDLVTDLCDESGATLVMVSHDPGDALRIAGVTAVVAEGRVTAPGPTAALLRDPPAALRAYLGR